MIVCDFCGDARIPIGGTCCFCGGKPITIFNTPLVGTKDRWVSQYIKPLDAGRSTPQLRRNTRSPHGTTGVLPPTPQHPTHPRRESKSTMGPRPMPRRSASSSRHPRDGLPPIPLRSATRQPGLPSILRAKEPNANRHHRHAEPRAEADSGHKVTERTGEEYLEHAQTAPPPRNPSIDPYAEVKKRLLVDLLHVHVVPEYEANFESEAKARTTARRAPIPPTPKSYTIQPAPTPGTLETGSHNFALGSPFELHISRISQSSQTASHPHEKFIRRITPSKYRCFEDIETGGQHPCKSTYAPKPGERDFLPLTSVPKDVRRDRYDPATTSRRHFDGQARRSDVIGDMERSDTATTVSFERRFGQRKGRGRSANGDGERSRRSQTQQAANTHDEGRVDEDAPPWVPLKTRRHRRMGDRLPVSEASQRHIHSDQSTAKPSSYQPERSCRPSIDRTMPGEYERGSTVLPHTPKAHSGTNSAIPRSTLDPGPSFQTWTTSPASYLPQPPCLPIGRETLARGRVAKLTEHFEMVISNHNAKSAPVSPSTPVRPGSASRVRFATVTIPPSHSTATNSPPDSTAVSTPTLGRANQDMTPPIADSRVNSSNSSTGRSGVPAIQRLGGGIAICPACTRSVAPLDHDRALGPFASVWHKACLRCGAGEHDNNGVLGPHPQGKAKVGCGKQLDSGAGSDGSRVWCKSCSMDHRPTLTRIISASTSLPRSSRIVSLKHPQPRYSLSPSYLALFYRSPSSTPVLHMSHNSMDGRDVDGDGVTRAHVVWKDGRAIDGPGLGRRGAVVDRRGRRVSGPRRCGEERV